MIEHHLEKLHCFFALAEEKSTVGASKKLAISQPAVSKNLRSLEDVLGQALMVRSRQGMLLTPAGRKLFLFCQALFAKVEDLEASLRSGDDIAGVLKIGTYETFSETFWPRLLEEFSRRYPALNVEIETENGNGLWMRLENGSIDLIVDAEPRQGEQYYSRVLFEDRFGVYKRRGSKIPETGAFPLPMSYVTSAIDRNGKGIQALLTDLGLKHRLMYRAQSFTFVRALTAQGLCVGVLPERLALQHLRSGRIEHYLADGKRIHFGRHRICATCPEHMRKNRRISAVISMMTEFLKKPRYERSAQDRG